MRSLTYGTNVSVGSGGGWVLEAPGPPVLPPFFSCLVKCSLAHCVVGLWSLKAVRQLKWWQGQHDCGGTYAVAGRRTTKAATGDGGVGVDGICWRLGDGVVS